MIIQMMRVLKKLQVIKKKKFFLKIFLLSLFIQNKTKYTIVPQIMTASTIQKTSCNLYSSLNVDVDA